MTLTSTNTPTQSVKSTIETISTRGTDCVLHVWNPRSQLHCSRTIKRNGRSRRVRSSSSSFQNKEPNGAVVLYHGFAAHARFPTIRYLAELLCQSNYIVYGMDFPGHGLSPGLRGYIDSSEDLIQDGMNVAAFAKYRHPDLPLFLAGVSMGGAIAINVSARCSDFIDGMLLLAPLISIEVSCLHKMLLRGLTRVMPKKGLFPAAEDAAAKQFRDPERRAEVLADTLSYSGSLRAASAQACLRLSRKTKKAIPLISCPFLCVIASNDVVVDNEGAVDLMMRSRSADKTLKAYDALHGLLCETQPLRGQIEGEIISWTGKRSQISKNPVPEETDNYDDNLTKNALEPWTPDRNLREPNDHQWPVKRKAQNDWNGQRDMKESKDGFGRDSPSVLDDLENALEL